MDLILITLLKILITWHILIYRVVGWLRKDSFFISLTLTRAGAEKGHTPNHQRLEEHQKVAVL
jgi:hypothetical protein